jgi:SPP1 gp7 family putative phage head morphogenesis protein
MGFETDWVFSALPFQEAVDYFKIRIPLTEEIFFNLQQDARMRAFTVSRMAGLDALKEIKDSLAKAIETGQSLADWKKGARGLLEQWAISGWHAETIYRTNLQTAYQVGRYEQMTDPDVVAMRPYWIYVAVMDGRTRPEHAALNGKVFPADDPFWDHWYPPNGFNCRCTVHTLSEAEAVRGNTKIQKGSDWYNKAVQTREGTIYLKPDEGWDFNPGKAGLTKI